MFSPGPLGSLYSPANGQLYMVNVVWGSSGDRCLGICKMNWWLT